MTFKIVSETAQVFRVVGIGKQFTSLDEAIVASIVRQLTTLGWGATAAIKVAEDRKDVMRILAEHIELSGRFEEAATKGKKLVEGDDHE